MSLNKIRFIKIRIDKLKASCETRLSELEEFHVPMNFKISYVCVDCNQIEFHICIYIV